MSDKLVAATEDTPPNVTHQAPLPPNDELFIEHCGHCNRKVGAINMVLE